MNTSARLIEDIKRHGIRLMLNDQGGLRVRGPKDVLSNDMVTRLRDHKQELIEALRDLDEDREERSAILEYDHGFTRKDADIEAVKRINFVTCGSCVHWEGSSPCGAGMVTSGDPIPGIRARICGFHTSRREQ